ncbi:PQQ-binding-like beta-propeller repeat protein [Halorhodospira halochloris]|uniref:outer membrane protein assembly factor BamB family protein n=1 Tax=Halorhodospira halochloris TaxID=1052 RepID=UPI001EE960E0|nr:PQQ-binding-like beta-propeller repeat protein [Halorhodospira halochloris]MCG5549284.1 PQQ-binding-like beta-propeller repeat protein [Halorhodospira halochloris]
MRKYTTIFIQALMANLSVAGTVQADKGEKHWIYDDFEERVYAVAYDQGVVLAGGRGETVKAINPETQEKLWAFDRHGDTIEAIVADSGVAYSGSSGRNEDHIRAIDIESGEQLWSFEGYGIQDLAVGGGSVYAASQGGEVISVDAHEGSKEWIFDGFETSLGSPSVNGIATDGERVYAAGDCDDYPVRALDADTGEVVWRMDHDEEMFGIGTNGSHVLAGDTDNVIHTLDAETGESVKEYKGHHRTPQDIAVDDELFYSASSDETLRVGYVYAGTEYHVFDSFENDVNSVTLDQGIIYSASGGRLGSDDNAVRAFSLNQHPDDEHQQEEGGNNQEASSHEGESIVDLFHARWEVKDIDGGDDLYSFDDKVYIGDSNEKIIALDARSGDRLWDVPYASSVPYIDEDHIYTSDGNTIKILDRQTGEVDQQWDDYDIDPSYGSSHIVSQDDILWITEGEKFFVYNINEQEKIWEREFSRRADFLSRHDKNIIYSSGEEVGLYTPEGDPLPWYDDWANAQDSAYDSDKIYIGASREVKAFESTSRFDHRCERWRCIPPEWTYEHDGSVESVEHYDGKIYALGDIRRDKNGIRVLDPETGDKVQTIEVASGAIDFEISDGWLYVLIRDRRDRILRSIRIQ